MQKMSVTLNLTAKDMVVCGEQLFLRDIMRRRGLWILYAICLIESCLSQAYFSGNLLDAFCWFIVCWLPAFIVFIVFVGVPSQSWIYYRDNRERLSNVVITISPENLLNEAKSAGVTAVYEWAAISNIELRKHYIWIQVLKHPPVVICVPLRSFQDADEAEEFYRQAYSFWQQGKLRQ